MKALPRHDVRQIIMAPDGPLVHPEPRPGWCRLFVMRASPGSGHWHRVWPVIWCRAWAPLSGRDNSSWHNIQTQTTGRRAARGRKGHSNYRLTGPDTLGLRQPIRGQERNHWPMRWQEQTGAVDVSLVLDTGTGVWTVKDIIIREPRARDRDQEHSQERTVGRENMFPEFWSPGKLIFWQSTSRRRELWIVIEFPENPDIAVFDRHRISVSGEQTPDACVSIREGREAMRGLSRRCLVTDEKINNCPSGRSRVSGESRDQAPGDAAPLPASHSVAGGTWRG